MSGGWTQRQARAQNTRCGRRKARLRRDCRIGESDARTHEDAAQADVDKVLSHVNSYSRPALNDKAPFDLFAFTYGADILAKLGIRRIPANEILLKPSLLG